ncbi:2',5'-phosphodiesterase 12 [Diaphorina citri]|uniref:2',5'-phosphodiesterase 12 n=1 Tax=Diaphorina citri TaxID=121845 RepID=A0A3Q0JDY2_DIACI|nr:2',5'-phosphodiesterase 12 [Diaphorina citri]
MTLIPSVWKSSYIVSSHFSLQLVFRRFKSISSYPRLIFNKAHIMNPAYFRYEDGGDKFQLAFEYNNEKYNIGRQFNMERSINESTLDFKTRIKSNVLKALEKKIHVLNKKRDKDSKLAVPDIKVDILINGQIISDDSIAKEAIFTKTPPSGENILKVDDTAFKIIINGPWIRNLKLPSCILQDCFVYPSKYEHQFASDKLTVFQWWRQEDKEFVPVGQGFYYKPSKEDVGHILKLSCTPKNDIAEGPTLEILSNTPVDAGNQPYLFEQRHAFTGDKLSGDNFRVVTYNILAEIYADTDTARKELFVYCPSYALDGDYRRPLIIREILAYHADLICLQEVDEKAFHRDLSPILLRKGNLRADFAVKSGNAAEGLAIFWDDSRFRFVQSSRYLLGEELALNHSYHSDLVSQIKANERLYTRLSERNTTLQTVVLEPLNVNSKRSKKCRWRQEDKEFVPVGQGFYYKPSKEDVGHILKLSCTPKNDIAEGPTLEILSNTPVDAGNQPYLFEQRHAFTQDKLSGDKVVTYNILAEIYADTDTARKELFVYCPSYALDGDYRRPLIIREILAYHADLICLQEVDEKAFHRDLSPFTGDKLSGDKVVTYNILAEIYADTDTARKELFVYCPSYALDGDYRRPLIIREILAYHADLICLQEVDEKAFHRDLSPVVTYNILAEIYADTDTARKELFVYCPSYALDGDYRRPLIIREILAYHTDLICLQEVDEKAFHRDLSPFAVLEKIELSHVLFSDQDEVIEGIPLSQPFPMASACGTPEFTNFTVGFSGCLDYIYYQKDQLKVTQVVPFPSKEELELYSGLPSPVYPSDHLALIADLQWIEPGTS